MVPVSLRPTLWKMGRHPVSLPSITGIQSNGPDVDHIYNKKTLGHSQGHMEPPQPQPPHTWGDIKMSLLDKINNRVRFNLGRGMCRLPSRCQFIFNTKLHSLLSRPMHQRLPWIAEVSSARLCYRWKFSQLIPQMDTNQSLVSYITDSQLIPSLTKTDH